MTIFTNAYGEELQLNSEQERCLNYHLGEKTLMVKGYAGAGKSVVLQRLALQYVNMYPEGRRDHKIGVFTFTNALTTTTRELLEANVGGKDIYLSTLNHYLQDVYKAMGGPFRKMYDGYIRRENIKLALSMHERQNGHHRFHDLEPQFWEEEIDWMKGMNVSVDDMKEYLLMPRTGRGSSVRMSQKDRETAFQIFCQYCQVIDKKGCGDWADLPLYINKKLREYEAAKEKGMNVKNPIPDELMFDIIFIDEAQDLSLAQMLASMGLYRKAMVIAMDAHQRIYAANWTAKQLGIDTQTQWLRKSMRNTVEIDDLAESLRKHNDGIINDNEKRAIPDRHGDKPVIVGLKDSAEERTFVINQIKTWINESSKIRVAIIGVTNKQIEQYSMWLSDADIYHEIISKDSTFSMKTPGVKILNAYNAKGLEFFRVIIPEFTEGKFPFSPKSDDPDDRELFWAQFRSLAYVAMTRAQETLVISFAGKKPSRFIGEMDSTMYEKHGNFSINPVPAVRPVIKSSSVNDTKVLATSTKNVSSDTSSLLAFFESKGYRCVDKRKNTGGSLWVIGSRAELTPIVREAKKIFGDLGNDNFAEHGGKATDHQPAWYITANK